MIWFNDNVSLLHYFSIKVLKTGRVPEHIAFIMDGNRRYAKKKGVKSDVGHSKGFDKLTEILKWCSVLGVREVTVYAFSIENFKRTQEEVNTIMNIAYEKLKCFLEEINEVNNLGLRLVITGRLSLLPKDFNAIASSCMIATRRNKKLRLNIAVAYTGRDEISRAASHIVDRVKNKQLTPDDIDEDLITSSLELGEPDLLVRTSGEVRLSDFMLWQVSNTVLYFCDVLWPELTIWNLLAAIIHYQRHAPASKAVMPFSKTRQMFLDQLNNRRLQQRLNEVSLTQ
ncbi:dehydrodolichyl diphosphate synthase complex subunit Dhdds-like [Achroia grisella]|uniref:dehydrodolichyl diphosphate synthase complex subunit Dhdds-like n=1 Tax=Achroia grisella TaxID=688607 RepID=UPI0027D2CC3D|nr:dehydrodolichyl diphosphate synthase complex subunit Dhdds-like [Achroia grisella]